MTKLNTQTIHRKPLVTPAGPVELSFNLEAGWLEITAPQQIPLSHIRALIFSLEQIEMLWKKRGGTTIRSTDGDDLNADWQVANRLMKKE